MKRKSILRFTHEFVPVAMTIAMGASPLHADSAIWTGAAADNNWVTLGNWTTVPDPVTPPASVPGTNPGETAAFSGIGTAGLDVIPPAIPVAPATTGAVKFLNFSGSLSNTFAPQANPALNAIAIEDTGAVTMAAGTAAQGTSGSPVPLHILGDAAITNNSDALLFAQISYAGIEGDVMTFNGTGNIQLKTTFGSVSTPGSVVKNGNGTLILAASNNTNVTGGYTLNAGTVVSPHQNGLSNRNLTLNGGKIEMTANQASSYTGVVMNGDFTLSLGGTNNQNQWNRNTSVTGALGQLTSTNSPVFTIQTVPPVAPAEPTTSYLTMGLDTSLFNGTFKIGGPTSGGLLMIGATTAANNSNARLDIGEAGVVGQHIVGSGTALTSGSNIVPIVFGELKGANTAGKLAGKRQTSTRTTGTRYEIGGLGTDTTFSGSIVDGVASNGARQMNGNPDCTASVAPDVAVAYARTNGAAGAQGVVEFVKTGAGTLTLLSESTHTGGTVVKGGALAVSSDGALGAAYDGSLRPFSIILGSGVYAATDLPDASLSGGNPTTPAAIGLYSSQFGQWGSNREFMSFSSQPTDVDSGNITNTTVGSGYVSIPTVSFSGGTMTTAGTPPIAEVRVKGLLTLDGGTLKTNAAITSNRATVLGAGGGTINTNGFDSAFSGIFNGSGGLTKAGAGKLTLTGANTYTGDTTVSGGVLSVNGTSLADTAKLAVAGGQVELTANETVGTLSIDGAGKKAGTYGSTASGVADPDDVHFTGNGVLTVTSDSGGGGGYATWAALNAPGQTADQDYDHDGVSNGVEFFMGQSGSSFTANPPLVNGKISWLKSPAFTGTYLVQTSSTMADGSWTDIPENGTNPKDTGTAVEYTPPTGQGKLFVRLKVVPN